MPTDLDRDLEKALRRGGANAIFDLLRRYDAHALLAAYDVRKRRQRKPGRPMVNDGLLVIRMIPMLQRGKSYWTAAITVARNVAANERQAEAIAKRICRKCKEYAGRVGWYEQPANVTPLPQRSRKTRAAAILQPLSGLGF
jgi:hypothetical protein